MRIKFDPRNIRSGTEAAAYSRAKELLDKSKELLEALKARDNGPNDLDPAVGSLRLDQQTRASSYYPSEMASYAFDGSMTWTDAEKKVDVKVKLPGFFSGPDLRYHEEQKRAFVFFGKRSTDAVYTLYDAKVTEHGASGELTLDDPDFEPVSEAGYRELQVAVQSMRQRVAEAADRLLAAGVATAGRIVLGSERLDFEPLSRKVLRYESDTRGNALPTEGGDVVTRGQRFVYALGDDGSEVFADSRYTLSSRVDDDASYGTRWTVAPNGAITSEPTRTGLSDTERYERWGRDDYSSRRWR